MTEFMGLIKGQYQAKSSKSGPGGGSLHQSLIPHGSDEELFEAASQQDTSLPTRVADVTMAFMFATCLTLKLSPWPLTESIDSEDPDCWRGLARISVRSMNALQETS